ncbi:unnamed protein product [Alopecurus aequalis]
MAVLTKNTIALCLGALMLMANLLSSHAARGQPSLMHLPGYVGCFEPHQNCFPDDCQKKCEDNLGLGKNVIGSCELDHVLNPYSQFACCCSRKTLAGSDDKHA